MDKVKGMAGTKKPDLVQGDKVLVDNTRMFKKGTESRWSDKVYVVQSVKEGGRGRGGL